MNIGILTFHMAHNCGAMLQAYALSNYISNTFHVNCEIIDYRLPEIYQKYDRLLNKKPVEPRRIKYDSFMKYSLLLSKRVYNLSEVKTYDLFIVGSDQIWNSSITHGYKKEYFAKCFPPDSFCIAYAASTGTPIQNHKLFIDNLSEFRHISVRESWLQKCLNKFLEKEISLCLDPVLLINREHWECLIKKSISRYDSYIIVYAFELCSDDYQYIKKWAKQNNLNIIELVTHEREQMDWIIYENDYGPLEWLEYISNSLYIFTDSFHAILFSIIFDKPFFYVNHCNDKYTRVSDTLERLQIYQNHYGFYYKSCNTEQLLKENKMISYNYLKKIIEEVKNEKTNI